MIKTFNFKFNFLTTKFKINNFQNILLKIKLQILHTNILSKRIINGTYTHYSKKFEKQIKNKSYFFNKFTKYISFRWFGIR